MKLNNPSLVQGYCEPENQMRAGKAARRAGLLPPPVGTSDWVRFSRTSYCVDKTLILKDLVDSETTVVLFTRPRRFGKTTMLKMIRAFYEPETLVDGRGMVKTEEFFTDKKIWAADGGKYRAEQGKRPVILIDEYDQPITSASAHGYYDEMCGFMRVFLSGAMKECFDIALKPLVEPFPAFIIEVKAADSGKDDLKALAREARAQIDGKKYDTTFRAEGITEIEKIGLAYFKEKVELCKL